MDLNKRNATPALASQSTLFSRVALMLTGSIALSALGSYLGRNITSTGTIITLMVIFIGGAFVVPFIAKRNPQAAIAVLMGWTFASGLFIAPAISSYAHQLGTHTVVLAYLGTGAVMAVAGLLGACSGRDFSRLGRTLMIALFALIAVGFVGMFLGFSQGVNIVYALAGMAVFAGFFIFDFFRLSKSANTTYNAVTLTMSIYLDYINFLLFLLRALSAIFSGGNSSRK